MNSKNEIIIEYEIYEHEKKIKIFGSKFVKNNKNKCKIVSKGKEYELKEELEVINCDIYRKIKEETMVYFKINLIGIMNVNDMSYMFDGCYSLKSLINIKDLNVIKQKHLSNIIIIIKNKLTLK